MTALTWTVHGIWEADAVSIDFHGPIIDPTDDSISVILGEGRTATVTLSAHEEIAGVLSDQVQVPYAICLRAYHAGEIKFRGVVTVQAIDTTAETIRLDAVDPSVRMTRHFLRRGDLADTLGQAELTADNGDQGWVSIDHRGLRALIAAADTDGFAPLGILTAGTYNDFDESTNLMGVGRGDQVWEKFLQVVAAAGPDFDLKPLDSLQSVELNTYTSLGDDLSQYGMALHHGCGLNNIEGMQLVNGEQYTNLVHAVDSDASFRVTKANATTLARTGPYIDWVSTGFGAADGVPATQIRDAVEGHADDVLRAIGEPSRALTITLGPEAGMRFGADAFGFTFGYDYYIGDRIPVAGRAGLVQIPEELYRIIAVTLRHDGEDIRPELTVVASAAGTIDDTDA